MKLRNKNIYILYNFYPQEVFSITGILRLTNKYIINVKMLRGMNNMNWKCRELINSGSSLREGYVQGVTSE